MPRSKTAVPDIEPLTVRIPRSILEIFRQSAQANDRSLNAEIVHALRKWAQPYRSQQGDYAQSGCRDQ
jgi:predicted HicB family RNase H-like nuclease